MYNTGFSESEKQYILSEREAGRSYVEIANGLHSQFHSIKHPDTVRYWTIKWNTFGVPESSNSSTDVVEEAAEEIDFGELVRKNKSQESLRAETEYYKRLYHQAIKDSVGLDKIADVAANIVTAIPAVEVVARTGRAIATHPQTAVAPLCDTHIGEYVDFAQMGGLNVYDMDIFSKRLRGWAEQVVNLVELRRNFVTIPRLVVPMLGDMISGDIHLELVKTNLDNVMGQMIRGAHMIAQALIFLSRHFDEVFVPCVVGNHGRMTQKPPAKDKYVDWDYLMFQFVAAFCKNQKNIKFDIPKSFMHVFQVEGKNILIMHGDSVKSWQGVPYYGILRAVSNLRQIVQLRRGLEEDIVKMAQGKDFDDRALLSLLASYFDSVMIGHFHRVDEIDVGTGEIYICGCMKGADEFSFARLHVSSKPKQIVTYWHPTYGCVGKDIVYLDKYDKSEEKFVDALPDVWADAIE